VRCGGTCRHRRKSRPGGLGASRSRPVEAPLQCRPPDSDAHCAPGRSGSTSRILVTRRVPRAHGLSVDETAPRFEAWTGVDGIGPVDSEVPPGARRPPGYQSKAVPISI
jgi:hypothetical protein